MLETLNNIDITWLNSIREFFYVEASWYPAFIGALGDSLVLFVAILLVWMWLTGVRRREDVYKRRALTIFSLILGAMVIYLILNQFLPVRPRPESVSAIPPLISHLPDNSFPSGHAIFAIVSLLSVVWVGIHRSLIWTIGVLGVLMCLARIVSGVHYPGDIIAGYIIGTIGFFFVLPIVGSRFFQSRIIPIPVRIARFLKL